MTITSGDEILDAIKRLCFRSFYYMLSVSEKITVQ